MENSKIAFTVLVVTYNSDYLKLVMTLETIIQQNMKHKFQIVIADDGSKEQYFSEVEAFFKKKNFTDYKIVCNKKNAGTVKNLLSGLEVAQGKYVKFLSAGDGFYASDTMNKIYEFMEKTNAPVCFGLLRGYRKNEQGTMESVAYYHPFDIQAYRKNDIKRIQRNLILYSDNVCGAAICYRTDVAKEYMKKISDCVVYEEDIFQVLAAVEGKAVQLYDDYMIWYEIGDGISTNKKSKFQELLAVDVDHFYKKLYEWHPENKYIRKRFKLMKYYKIKNLYIRTIFRTFENPHAIVYLFRSFVQRMQGVHQKECTQIGFLEQDEFWRKL